MRYAGTRRAALLVACLLLAGCGNAAPLVDAGSAALPAVPAVGVPAPPAASASAALAGWDRFPAGARPRPIVITAPPLGPANGYATDEAKIAAMAGRYELATPLPPDPPATMPVALPDGPADLPTRSARAAFDTLLTGSPTPDTSALRITGVELGTATFDSDRGPLPLPAWVFTGADMVGTIAVPAVAPSTLWSADRPLLVSSGSARLAPDGRTLTVTLPTAGPGCPGAPRFRFEPDVAESASAVAVALRAIPDGVEPGTPPEACALDLRSNQVDQTVTLVAPLGGRVLVEPIGEGYSTVLAVVPG